MEKVRNKVSKIQASFSSSEERVLLEPYLNLYAATKNSCDVLMLCAKVFPPKTLIFLSEFRCCHLLGLRRCVLVK